MVEEENLGCEGRRSAGGREGTELARVDRSYAKFGCECFTHGRPQAQGAELVRGGFCYI